LSRLDIAQASLALCSLLQEFEKKGLCDQLQRASVSIGSNIAEGSAKPSNADFARFLDTALGSTYEVETQLLIANKVGYIKDDTYQELLNELIEIERQIAVLIRTLRS
jgi:four helix bundle protein